MNTLFVSPQGWRFHNPVVVYFGRSERKQIIERLIGKRCLVVTTARGRIQFNADDILCNLEKSSSLTWLDCVRSNPDLNDLKKIISSFSMIQFEAVIAFGGGSVIDSAKVISVALAAELKLIQLERMIEDSSLLESIHPIPLYALPTTAGTGSEVTPFATIWDSQAKMKYSLSSEAIFPYIAVIDPDLTDNLPPDVTISVGLDAINQAVESIWNKNASPITIALATRALRLGLRSLPNLINEDGGSSDRDGMAECSLLAGLAISQTRTALCHSISYPLTAHFGVPHGLACGFTMPFVLRHNLRGDDGRFTHLAKDLLGDTAARSDLIELFDNFHSALSVRNRVAAYIPSFDDLDQLAGGMLTPNRAGNNLVEIDIVGIRNIIAQAWGGKAS